MSDPKEKDEQEKGAARPADLTDPAVDTETADNPPPDDDGQDEGNIPEPPR